MSETCARKPGQMSPRNRRMIRKSLQNPSKMAPKWLPGGLWAASGAQGVSEGASRSSFEGSWGALGGSWGLLGSLLAPLGVVLGLPRCPRRLPEGPREGPGEPPGRHFGSFFAAGPAGAEKVRKHMFASFLMTNFSVFFMFFHRLTGGAGASAHLEKTRFGVEGIQNFACRPFSRGTKNSRIQ